MSTKKTKVRGGRAKPAMKSVAAAIAAAPATAANGAQRSARSLWNEVDLADRCVLFALHLIASNHPAVASMAAYNDEWLERELLSRKTRVKLVTVEDASGVITSWCRANPGQLDAIDGEALGMAAVFAKNAEQLSEAARQAAASEAVARFLKRTAGHGFGADGATRA